MRLPPEIERMMLEMQVAQIERLEREAKADPVKHKLCMVFPGGPRYRYFAKQRRGLVIRWCWSVNRNAAGYFLSWRETVNAKRGGGKRDRFVASRTRAKMKARALKLHRS